MSPRFTVDLARPGLAQRSRWDWFLGPEGPRHLVIVAAGGILLVALVGIGGLLPRYWRYSSELQSIAKLRVDAAAADRELSTVQVSLRDLDASALRQVRWAEILPALSKSLPGTLRIDRVTLSKGLRQGLSGTASATAKPDAKAGDVKNADLVLQIDASTNIVPGGSRLVDIANFMAAVSTDPAVSRRFQLKTWDIQRPQQQTGEEQLRITIALAEKRS
jgi:hypothetical protein